MDVISFSEAATANGRIEKINANPDSSSGIVTVPKTIAIGETITIPAGRVAILPNLVIDGVLNIENDGEVFIPSGSTFGDLDAQIALKATLESPALTGTPTAPTQVAQDNSTKLATTAYVDGKMVLGTAVNTTSGTAIDFTSIPSWVKRLSITFNGVSTNGSSLVQIQLGDSGGIETTGYNAVGLGIGSSSGAITSTNGFIIGETNSPTYILYGKFDLINVGNNIWTIDGSAFRTAIAAISKATGGKNLSATLDRIRITTTNGTDSFDAGSINILYEG